MRAIAFIPFFGLLNFPALAAEPAPRGSASARAAREHEPAAVETPKPRIEDERNLALLAGVSQLFLGGANVQLDVTYGRFVADFSHGWSLDIGAGSTVGEQKAQQLALHLPYTTGFGFGYRLLESLDVRFEPKLHRFDIFYADLEQTSSNEITSYQTATLGLGVYYRWQPFRKLNPIAQGIIIMPSLRYWHNVWSSLQDDRFVYTNARTGNEETHRASNIGIANTPWIVNVSLGYSFEL
jgi:hypothetical protein